MIDVLRGCLNAAVIDFDKRVIWVRRTWGSRKKEVGEDLINTPKSGKERAVDMSQQLGQVVRLHPETFRKYYWVPLLTLSGLTYRKPHTLRHTYASLLIQNGDNLAYVRDQLGHASIKITADTYGHLVPVGNKRAVDRLDDTSASHTVRGVPRRILSVSTELDTASVPAKEAM